VLEKGSTSNGAATDVGGNFTLSVPDGNAVLSFSYVGYEPQEVPVRNQANISVTLAPDRKAPEEVVVSGYQPVTRKELTGSVSLVSSKQIADIPVSTAAEVLAGRQAGVQVTTSEGQPGADVQIRVRGGGSVTQDNSPLYSRWYTGGKCYFISLTSGNPADRRVEGCSLHGYIWCPRCQRRGGDHHERRCGDANAGDL